MAVTVFTNCWEGGSVEISTCRVRVTVAVAPGAIRPIGIPAEGSMPGWGTPLIITLFGTKSPPAGTGSVRVVLAAMLPLFVIFTK
ncbi:hypothetical protein D3C76_1627550 [compost metagenome]